MLQENSVAKNVSWTELQGIKEGHNILPVPINKGNPVNDHSRNYLLPPCLKYNYFITFIARPVKQARPIQQWDFTLKTDCEPYINVTTYSFMTRYLMLTIIFHFMYIL